MEQVGRSGGQAPDCLKEQVSGGCAARPSLEKAPCSYPPTFANRSIDDVFIDDALSANAIARVQDSQASDGRRPRRHGRAAVVVDPVNTVDLVAAVFTARALSTPSARAGLGSARAEGSGARAATRPVARRGIGPVSPGPSRSHGDGGAQPLPPQLGVTPPVKDWGVDRSPSSVSVVLTSASAPTLTLR
jgi:hypothetical protein